MGERLLKTESAAAKFDLSPTHFKRLVKAEKLPKPVNWVTEELRWLESELDAFIVAQARREAAEAKQ